MDLPTLTISASEGWLDQRKRFSSNIAGKEQKNYTLLKKGQLSYNHGNSKLAKYGVVYSLKNYEEALVPRVYHSFTVNSSINSDFIELVFATKLPDRELGKLVTSGARMDGLLNINYDDFMGIVITIPKIDEQKRIRNLFNMINKLITLHQRKLEQLEQLKNTLLSKMFPKSGTNIPEIRFSGFTDAWKQRKLEEIIVKEIKGKAKSENISTNFANKGSLYLDTEYLNGGKPKYVSLPSDTDENDIIILWDGSQARKLYKGVVGALGSTLKAYKIPEHTLFYYYQMLGSQEKIYNQYRTPNIPHVVKSFTSEFMIWDTSNDEKTLIIDIYSNLFNYIAIHQRKLDQLKNLKQTLLNKMFI
ncbi:restriction endonuclease subunit S [Enterococcus cecorum]